MAKLKINDMKITEGADSAPNRLYSTKEAAAYLRMSVPNLKYHISKGHIIPTQRIGANLAFSQAVLDAFTPNPPGRPKRAADSDSERF